MEKKYPRRLSTRICKNGIMMWMDMEQRPALFMRNQRIKNREKFLLHGFHAAVPYIMQVIRPMKSKVNQRVYDIVDGCGTYGHPYVITSAGEMTIISEYLSTGMPRNDWKVTITKISQNFAVGIRILRFGIMEKTGKR